MTTDTTDSGSLHRDAQGKGPQENGPRDNRWYFRLMAPNTKGDKFAWLDPTSIYINGAAFTDLLDDLCADLDADTIDVVAGLDAMGFVLGAGIATRLGRGLSLIHI